jgi:hypothetical protein
MIKEWAKRQFTPENDSKSWNETIKEFVKEGMFAGAKAMRDNKIN